jgi:uncharacterized membrane protein YphA (DoxX/SURF4 family)
MKKFIAQLARILVGAEFVFSGFVKVVDPYGTGLKLKEYFEVFAGDLPSLAPFFHSLAANSLALSVIFCCLELVLGVALLFNFKLRISAWVVLFLMIFFTFLTFYSAFFNKVTDCGCFGDFYKLKPWTSFYKDVVSLLVILIVVANRKVYVKSEWGAPMTLIALIFSLGIAFYGIRYLPILDFLPYAKGKNIPDQMKRPDVKPLLDFVFFDKKLAEEIHTSEYLADTNRYKYLSSTVLNEELLTAKITDFSLTDTAGNDRTPYAFEGIKILVIFKNKKGLEGLDLSPISKLFKQLAHHQAVPIILTSMPSDEYKRYIGVQKFRAEVFTSDEKVLKTMARANPTLVLLKEGVVMQKWSIYNVPSIDKINEVLTNK